MSYCTSYHFNAAPSHVGGRSRITIIRARFHTCVLPCQRHRTRDPTRHELCSFSSFSSDVGAYVDNNDDEKEEEDDAEEAEDGCGGLIGGDRRFRTKSSFINSGASSEVIVSGGHWSVPASLLSFWSPVGFDGFLTNLRLTRTKLPRCSASACRGFLRSK